MAADLTSKVPIGTVLVGKYRITREIGRGGMAVVYEAENVSIGKRVAVKVLSAELITSRVVRERFLREARAAAAVRSPYICDVYDAGEFDNRPFLVMELLEGESLYDLMSNVRRLDTDQTLKIIVQTAKGLAKAHAAHVVHRDLKPENLFLTRNEDGELITKLLDFGLAKFYVPSDDSAEQVRLTREGALFGTPAYMSPEQARGRGEVDHRSDLWALGCIVYECLTGQTVWNVEQGVAMILAQVANAPLPVPTHLRPDLTSAFDAWFEKALARDPNQRFQTAREFALALAEVLGPSDKSALQTPSMLVDVDELTSRIGIPSEDRAPLSGNRSTAGQAPNAPVAPSHTTETAPNALAGNSVLGMFDGPFRPWPIGRWLGSAPRCRVCRGRIVLRVPKLETRASALTQCSPCDCECQRLGLGRTYKAKPRIGRLCRAHIPGARRAGARQSSAGVVGTGGGHSQRRGRAGQEPPCPCPSRPRKSQRPLSPCGVGAPSTVWRYGRGRNPPIGG